MSESIPWCAKYYYNKECNSLIKDSDYFTKGDISIYYYRGCADYKCGHNNKLRVPIVKINNVVIGLRPFRETGIPIPFRLLPAYDIKPKIIISQFRKEFGELCALKPNHGIYSGEMQHMVSIYRMRQTIKYIPSHVYKKRIDKYITIMRVIFDRIIFLPNEILEIITKFII
ncbi:Hypothetical protein PACV_305 [Pacmanvirus A23]|uniref:Hypothetical protein n=1 Tax=Pacmanvirus A23 TaxID=1932881 RepID=UPI000A0924AE|nr:Hypothetical protein B9W72_gp301 [Pacmanvirus A23]SIP86018.1 Hypothetical protein PACV_305 [Pacmanvirus A23]